MGVGGVVVEAQSKSIGPGSWNQQRALRTRWTPRFGPAEAPRVRWGDIGEGSGRLLGGYPRDAPAVARPLPNSRLLDSPLPGLAEVQPPDQRPSGQPLTPRPAAEKGAGGGSVDTGHVARGPGGAHPPPAARPVPGAG